MGRRKAVRPLRGGARASGITHSEVPAVRLPPRGPAFATASGPPQPAWAWRWALAEAVSAPGWQPLPSTSGTEMRWT